MFATWSLGYEAIDAPLLKQIRHYLGTQEVANCIQLAGFMSDAGTAPGTTVLVARDTDGVKGVATQTGAYLVMLSHMSDPAALSTMVSAQLAHAPRIPGVMGPPDVTLAHADLWAAHTGGSYTAGMAQRILQADHVVPPTDVAGSARKVTAADHAMLRQWFADFGSEAEHLPPDKARRAADGMISRLGHDGGAMLWLDEAGTPVSIACFKGKTPHGIRIGPVFTPEEHRRHGYGAAISAVTTQRMLDLGFQFVCLYTDATNPTSNGVYESIGFTFVADSMQYRFSAMADERDD